MTDATTNPAPPPSIWRRPWVKYTAAVLAAMLALAWLLAPRRVWEVASVDEALRWRQDEAPPRRAIVWRPAVAVDSLPVEVSEAESVIRPQLADHGATLYFTRRKDGHTDIYRAHRTGGGWSSAEPITAWNSDHDDIGPVLDEEGRRAYLYSNRPGGYGGFDLYVSRREGARWLPPQNLGPRVNSPAHEYDPATTPDGSRLFFASNRTPRMQKHAEAGGEFAQVAPWTTTLRAHLDAWPFDLYVVERARDGKSWAPPRALAELNLPQASEGAPYVAPGGAFLYFASDRPFREGETPNFDLYRARLRGSQASAAENLGAGVNSPRNELEPALSPEGFRLYFSRNRADDESTTFTDEAYTLYASTAVEVFDERAWDTRRTGALAGWLTRNWWRLVLGLLLAALLAAIVWCLREITLRRATVPVFFTLALLAHLFLAAGSFFVGLDDDLIALLPQEVREIIVAEPSFHDPDDAGQTPPQPFEQTAELENLESLEPQVAARPTQAAAPPSPITTAIRLNHDAPLPPNRLVYETTAPPVNPPPAPQAPSSPALALARRTAESLVDPRIAPETLPLPPAPPPPEMSPEEAPPLPHSLAERGRSLAAPSIEVSLSPAPHAPTFEPESAEAPPMVASPPAITAPVLTPRRAALDVAAREAAPAVQAEPAPAAETVAEADPADALRAEIAMPREATAAPLAPQQTAPAIALPRAAPTFAENGITAPEPPAAAPSPALAQHPSITLARSVAHQLAAAENVATLEPQPVLVADDENDAPGKPSVEVAIPRQEAQLPVATRLLPVSLMRANGPSRAAVAEDAEAARIEAEPAFRRPAHDLARRESRSPALMYAEDNIGLQAMLRLRQSEAKEDLLQAFGGSEQTEAAVRRGLAWLAQHQHRDGHWSLDRFAELCQEHHPKQKCGGHGRRSDTAATGFALLPFLGAGHTHQEGDYRDCVGRGLTWLASNQKSNGDLYTGGGGNGHMYSHGIAAIALCEAYAMTQDPRLREPAQRSLDFIVQAQHKSSGGWRYSPGQDGDTSVFGWQIMALKSGQMAGLNVPQETLDRAKKWLDRVGAKGKQLGQFGYTHPHPTAAMSAEALLSVQYLGAERNDPRLLQGGDYLLAHRYPTDTSYYWYYATQVMYHLQGEHWRQWNETQRDALVKTQVKEGGAAGTWDPKDRWEKDAGRLYATSLRLLMLEVYYRHLPLYQALE